MKHSITQRQFFLAALWLPIILPLLGIAVYKTLYPDWDILEDSLMTTLAAGTFPYFWFVFLIHRKYSKPENIVSCKTYVTMPFYYWAISVLAYIALAIITYPFERQSSLLVAIPIFGAPFIILIGFAYILFALTIQWALKKTGFIKN